MSRFQFYRTDQRRLRWRLLGGNNRVLGLSSQDFDDQAAALVAVDLVRKCTVAAEFDLEHVPGGQWWWRMRPAVHGPELAGSSHGFARRVDAALSGSRFRLRAPGADIEFTVVVFEQGRRGREVPFDGCSSRQAAAEQPNPGAADMSPQHPIC